MRESLWLGWKVAMRNWAIYRKNFFSNILPTVTDPVFYMIVFGYWLGSHVAQIQGMQYANYLGPGMVLTTCLYTAFFEASYGFYIRMEFQGVYHAMMTTPVGAREILIGEFIWIALKSSAMATVTAIVLALFGVVSVKFLFLVPLIGALAGVGCGAIGLISAGYVRNIDQFQTVYALVISPMFFVSGIFFPIDQLPSWIQKLCFISPLYHGVLLGQSTLWAKNMPAIWALNGSALVGITALLSLWAIKKIYPKLYH